MTTRERVLREGTASPVKDGEDSLETSLPVPRGITAGQIKVYVDTNRVQSWPEIDAVELVATNGSRQWAGKSSASSSYSQHYGGTAVVLDSGTGATSSGPAASGGLR